MTLSNTGGGLFMCMNYEDHENWFDILENQAIDRKRNKEIVIYYGDKNGV